MALKHSIKVPMKDKVVMIRVDFNIPVRNGEIIDDYRIVKALPTINQVLEKDPKQIILVSHRGKPHGKENNLSLKPAFEHLKELLPDVRVGFAEDCLMDPLPTHKVVLLENTRFYDEERENNAKFAKKLAHGADVFVFDAFGTAHRSHASTVGVTKHIPKHCIGLLVEQELKVLALKDVPRPFVAILGSSKIKDKIPVIEHLLPRVDKFLVGGAVVFTFLKAIGYEVGKSLVEDENLAVAKRLYEENGEKIILPVDIVVAHDEHDGELFTVDADKIPADMKGLDVGDETIALFEDNLKLASTVFWNGPLGLFEVPPFDHATNEIAEFLAKSKAITIVGGGDTEIAIRPLGHSLDYTHMSTGGGAALELVAGHTLVAIENLKNEK